MRWFITAANKLARILAKHNLVANLYLCGMTNFEVVIFIMTILIVLSAFTDKI